MSQTTPNPFTGLDKALLRSTRQPARSPATPALDEIASADDHVDHTLYEAPPPAVQGSAPARQHASDGASTLASTTARSPAQRKLGEDDVIQAIRKTVRVPGREVSFVRLSRAEKDELGDIVHAYKRQGKKTSETEINRIAVNYLIADYKANGEQSVLARVIEALLA